jgi:hypothetical protein
MWSDGLRSRGTSHLSARVAGTPLRGRVPQGSTLGTAVGRTRRVAGAPRSRSVSLGRRRVFSVPQQRLLAARQPRITLLYLAGSPEQAHREPPDRARTESPIPWPAAAQSREPGGEPEWSGPHAAVEMSRPPVAAEPASKLLLVTCLVAALGLIAGTAYIVTRHSGSAPGGNALPSSTHVRTVSTPEQQATAWITANVAADTPVCADRTLAAQLGQAGFTAASSCRPNGSVGGNRFVVSTPDIRASVAASLTAIVGQSASFAVAEFGTKAERVEVRMVVPGPQTALSARLSRDLHERALAAAALLHNPKVTLTASARVALRRGQLDMRAATLLALVAAQTPVRVDTIMIRRPEQAAGRPARSITISVTEPGALMATMRILTGDYIPSFVTAAAGETRLDWPVGQAPTGGLS